jgi:hypothetical protein
VGVAGRGGRPAPSQNLIDRTPWIIAAALEYALTNNLFEAMIPGFALHRGYREIAEFIGEHRVFPRILPTG